MQMEMQVLHVLDLGPGWELAMSKVDRKVFPFRSSFIHEALTVEVILFFVAFGLADPFWFLSR